MVKGLEKPDNGPCPDVVKGLTKPDNNHCHIGQTGHGPSPSPPPHKYTHRTDRTRTSPLPSPPPHKYDSPCPDIVKGLATPDNNQSPDTAKGLTNLTIVNVQSVLTKNSATNVSILYDASEQHLTYHYATKAEQEKKKKKKKTQRKKEKRKIDRYFIFNSQSTAEVGKRKTKEEEGGGGDEEEGEAL